MAMTSSDLLSELTHECFAEEVGSTFLLDHGAAQPLTLELAQATQLGRAGVGSRRIPFSLIFRGPLEPVLPQKIYPLQHDRLGRLEIFLVPVGPDNDSMRYEAVFT